MSKKIDRAYVFSVMSGNFLTSHLPHDWTEWDGDKLEKFFEEHAWEPLEYWDWNDVYELIDICTHDVMHLLEEKAQSEENEDASDVA